MFNKILFEENEKGSFEEDFKEFMFCRQDSIKEISSEVNETYGNLLEKITALQKQIESLLPKKEKELVSDLDELECQSASIEMNLAYAKGLKDGMKMITLINS